MSLKGEYIGFDLVLNAGMSSNTLQSVTGKDIPRLTPATSFDSEDSRAHTRSRTAVHAPEQGIAINIQRTL
jgi:hypothetical protein